MKEYNRHAVKEIVQYGVMALVALAMVSMYMSSRATLNAVREIQESQVEGRRLSKENNSYLRVVACNSSSTPLKRTPDYVKNCYLEAENYNDNSITRFGDAQ